MILTVGLIFAAVVVSLFAELSSAQLPLARPRTVEIGTEILDASFDDWLKNLTSLWGMKGLSIAVVRQLPNDEWSVETKGYGIKNAAGDDVTDDTMFAIASNSKLFTALAVGTLVEGSNSSLKWTTKVADILKDDWKLEDPIAQKHANLLDILSHRTGLPRHDVGLRRGETAAEGVKALRYLRPSVEFRETEQYNNWMYMTAAYVVERLSGVRFSNYVQENIINRLPFSSATYNATKAKLSGNLADAFVRVKRNVPSGGLGWSKSVYEPTDFIIDSEVENIVAGPGGVIMSARDAATWLQTLLLYGKHPETQDSVIPPEAIMTVASGVTIQDPSPTYPEVSVTIYGAGQALYSYQGHNIVEHDGSLPGWQSVVSRAPQDGLGVAVFTNWDEGALVMYMIRYYLYEKALGLPHVDWSSRYLAALEAASAAVTNKSRTRPIDFASNSTSKFVGIYINPAYGRYDICTPPLHSPSSSPRCAKSDEYWELVRRSNASESPVEPSLSMTIPAIFGNYVQLHRISNSAFNLTAFDITTTPSTNNTDGGRKIVAPVFDFEPTVEFAVGNDGIIEGFGVRGFWGAGSGVESPTGKTVRERAEVWFDRVKQ